MPSILVTLSVVALWWLQGIGFVRRLLPTLRRQPIVEIVIATWFGALASLVLATELYYIIPGATIHQLAWPITLVLAAVSIFWFARSSRGPRQLDTTSIGVLAIAIVGLLLVLRPLLGSSHLGFYFSNNGEFANYAVLGDTVEFHGAGARVAGFGLRSREAVGSMHSAIAASLTNVSVFWLIQPVAAAYALLAFGALGVAFRKIAITYRVRGITLVALALLLAWAEWSSTAQCFWTLSFVSQYACVALWFGAFVLVLELPLDRARTVLLGMTLGALACVYPEMILPSTGLIGVCELARSPTRETLKSLALSACIALGVANRLGFELVLGHTGLVPGGWNIFGNHDHPLEFFASIAGLAHPFTKTAAHPTIVVIAALLAASGLGWSLYRARNAELRLVHVGAIAFALGTVAIFVLVAKRADHNNYIALKLLLGFGWLAFLAIASLIAAWPRFSLPSVLIVAVCWIDVSQSAFRFTKQLHQAGRLAFYSRGDAETLRTHLDDRPYVAAAWFNTYIIGAFMVYDQDLLGQLGRWPDLRSQELLPAKWVLLVDGFDVNTDPKLAGRSLHDEWIGPHVRLVRL